MPQLTPFHQVAYILQCSYKHLKVVPKEKSTLKYEESRETTYNPLILKLFFLGGTELASTCQSCNILSINLIIMCIIIIGNTPLPLPYKCPINCSIGSRVSH